MPAQLSSSPLDHGSELHGMSPITIVLLKTSSFLQVVESNSPISSSFPDFHALHFVLFGIVLSPFPLSLLRALHILFLRQTFCSFDNKDRCSPKLRNARTLETLSFSHSSRFFAYLAWLFSAKLNSLCNSMPPFGEETECKITLGQLGSTCMLHRFLKHVCEHVSEIYKPRPSNLPPAKFIDSLRSAERFRFENGDRRERHFRFLFVSNCLVPWDRFSPKDGSTRYGIIYLGVCEVVKCGERCYKKRSWGPKQKSCRDRNYGKNSLLASIVECWVGRPRTQMGHSVGEKNFPLANSDEDIKLNKSDCEESEESANVIDNIPVNPDTYVSRDGTEWIPHNSNVSGRFATKPRSSKLHETCQVIYSQFGLAIHQNDHQARRRFVEWAQNENSVVPDFHKRILFSDEAHFWLNGYVDKQNCRIWSEANPQVYVETPLHPEKLTVLCALWAVGIIGPYFFKNDEGHNVTVNGDRYRAMITNFFIPELNNHDVQELWFQQDGATCHTARATIDLLKDTFGDRLISRFGPVNWPPRSCDLTPLDYFLWCYVKSLVYVDKPQTLDHLEDNIRRVIADIRPQMLEKVIENWTSRLDYIRASRGSDMPEIIFKM
ncbi:transposable element Tc3 transposase [Trichonephila clavipes]|nr:transposable element Tc3 transposase [Trichonephila clavipes]